MTKITSWMRPGAPLLLFGVYYIRKPEHQMTSRKIIIVGGALCLGFPIWLFLNYVLYVPTWAPLHDHHGILNTLAIILLQCYHTVGRHTWWTDLAGEVFGRVS